MAGREYRCSQGNQNAPVPEPRRIYVFVEAALEKRIVRDVVVNLSVVTEAVLETVEVLAFKAVAATDTDRRCRRAQSNFHRNCSGPLRAASRMLLLPQRAPRADNGRDLF